MSDICDIWDEQIVETLMTKIGPAESQCWRR